MQISIDDSKKKDYNYVVKYRKQIKQIIWLKENPKKAKVYDEEDNVYDKINDQENKIYGEIEI